MRGVHRFPPTPLRLPDGTEVRPWGEARHRPGDDAAGAWDDLSRRDFTLLATPDKREARLGGEAFAVFTGYRRGDGR